MQIHQRARRTMIGTSIVLIGFSYVRAADGETNANDIRVDLKTVAALVSGAVIAALAFGSERARLRSRIARLEDKLGIPPERD